MEELAHRYRLVLPDLPLHGDSEDRPAHPYTPQWFAEVLAGFLRDTCGAAPAGRRPRGRRADPARRAIASAQLSARPAGADAQRDAPPPERAARERAVAMGVRARRRARAGPRCSRTARALLLRPALRRAAVGRAATPRRATSPPRAADLGGNANRARAWAKAARRWPTRRAAGPARRLPADRQCRRCCCGPTPTRATRWRSPKRRSTCCPTPSCACSPGTGFLMAYDDPVGLARELAAFCG